MTKDKERDDALIAEKRKLSNILEAITKLGTVGPWNDDLLRAAAILRGDERPKPDRLVEIFRALPLHGDAGCDKLTDDEWRLVAVAARTELHAEWEAERPAVVVPSEDQIKQIVTRFLSWKLPDDFHPDDGISFEPFFNIEWNAKQGKPPQRRTPTGTNLFNHTQALAMVRYIIDGAKGGE